MRNTALDNDGLENDRRKMEVDESKMKDWTLGYWDTYIQTQR